MGRRKRKRLPVAGDHAGDFERQQIRGKPALVRQDAERAVAAALDDLQNDAQHPYARGSCVNCGAIHVAWSEY